MQEKPGVRIAMWSGPRNISTALMRSWESRDDTFVCDEPFYAHYLRRTKIDHPGREEVVASQENDCRADEIFCTGTMGELAWVSAVDGRTIGSGAPGPMTGRLIELFRQETAANSYPVLAGP